MMIRAEKYDKIIVAFSGGKDSTACILHLLDIGINKDKIELWHQEIDGRDNVFMDWPVTPAYCRKFAEDLGIKIYFSWKDGGFEREMLRENQRTASTSFETPSGIKTAGGSGGKLSTRRKFPQTSANLSVRWCSAYLKIDVGSIAIKNQKRFHNSSTIFISGERAEESSGRSHYKKFEPHRTDNRNGKSKRLVDHWRPIHTWSQEDVWDIIEKYKIRVHPAYYIGWGRLSCATCIFGSVNQWASYYKINPDAVKKIFKYEQEFEFTINRKKSVMDMVKSGIPYEATNNDCLVSQALSKEYGEQIYIDDWVLPVGAFGEQEGSI